ncbi:MAG: acyl-CoA thioesterase [Planctomycetes bacterium]|nr:acyl-CoA thioesterase [Planctomycetota bacterium]
MSEKDKFHFSTEVRVRLPETDAFGISFHAWFFHYFDDGRMDYLRNLGLADSIKPTKGFHNVVVKASCEFKSPARFDDKLVVHVRIAEIKNSSFRFEFLVYHKKENRLVARGETIHVAIDAETWKPIPVPEEFRSKIRKFEGTLLSS